MTWLIVCAIFGVVFASAWRVDRIRERKQPVRRVKQDAYRDNYNTYDWFVYARAYRRSPATSGGGLFFGDCSGGGFSGKY